MNHQIIPPCANLTQVCPPGVGLVPTPYTNAHEQDGMQPTSGHHREAIAQGEGITPLRKRPPKRPMHLAPCVCVPIRGKNCPGRRCGSCAVLVPLRALSPGTCILSVPNVLHNSSASLAMPRHMARGNSVMTFGAKGVPRLTAPPTREYGNITLIVPVLQCGRHGVGCGRLIR